MDGWFRVNGTAAVRRWPSSGWWLGRDGTGSAVRVWTGMGTAQNHVESRGPRGVGGARDATDVEERRGRRGPHVVVGPGQRQSNPRPRVFPWDSTKCSAAVF